MRVNATTELYEDVTVLGVPMLFTCLRIDRDTVPKRLHVYEVRHDDEQQGIPVQIGNYVMTNHWGTLISATPVKLEPGSWGILAFRNISEKTDWIYEGRTSSLQQYMEVNHV